jgi:hypothetical protein
MSNDPVASREAELAWAFPSVEPGAKPLGARILVQLRRAKKKMTASGIIFVNNYRASILFFELNWHDLFLEFVGVLCSNGFLMALDSAREDVGRYKTQWSLSQRR